MQKTNKLEKEFLVYNIIKTIQHCLEYKNYKLVKELIDDLEQKHNKIVCDILRGKNANHR